MLLLPVEFNFELSQETRHRVTFSQANEFWWVHLDRLPD